MATDLQIMNFKKMLNVDIERDYARNLYMKAWGIGAQHLTGGIFSIPLLCGLGDPKVAVALTRHAALCEMGFEVGDFLAMIKTRMFEKDGAKKLPMVIIIVMSFHHSMTCLMAIPMNLNYGDKVIYAEILFIMQGAAAVAILIGQYSSMIDVKTDSGVSQMFWLTLLSSFIMFYTRGIHYLWIGYRMCKMFYDDGGM